MTKRYKILQKKLQDLESELSRALSRPFEPEPNQTEYFHNQFVFLNNLLSAEIASNPSKPHHLAHISNRLNELRVKFDNWELNRVEPDGSDPVETRSDCSCTESCLNDDVDDADPEEFYELESEPEPELEPKELFFEVDMGRVDGESENGVLDWANGPVLASGVAIGLGLVIGLLGEIYGCVYYYMNYQGSLIPT